MGNVIEIDMDESITLPPTCDSMPPELRGHLCAALTLACKRYKCKQGDLRWSVKIDPKSKQPYIRIRKV